MKAIVRTVGSKAEIIFVKEGNIEELMQKLYNISVKKAKMLDWKNTYYDGNRNYAKIDDWETVTEYREIELEERR